MAAPGALSEPFEYFRIFDLPAAAALPEELRGRILFTKANFVHSNAEGAANSGSSVKAGGSKSISRSQGNSASATVGAPRAGPGKAKVSGGGFNYSKALKAALDGSGSSVISRGDGKYQDGSDFAVSDAPGGRAKFVHLTPDAMAPGNAERTLQQLDLLQKMAGRPQSGLAGTAGGAPKGDAGSATAPLRSVQQQHAAALAAAANILYDINDEDAGSVNPLDVGSAVAPTHPTRMRMTTATANASAVTASASQPGESPTVLRTPEYTLRELPGGPTGQQGQQVEVSVLLPEVSSPGDVDVWLGTGGELQVAVPGKYQLKLDLPYPVLDDTSHAKWSKAKKRLTLTLTKKLTR